MTNFTIVGKAAHVTRAATFWKDGDTTSFHWNYWNPIAWLFIIPLVILVFIVGGLKELIDNHYHYGFGYSKYWKARLKQREFF
jgi:ABC-type Fe3+-siderophore transport system permease subunit